MGISAILLGGPTQAPMPTADFRPTADAAALADDPRPATSAMSALPPSLSQTAEVSRALVAASATDGEVQEVVRVLKPWGVTMLPAEPRNGSEAPPRPRHGSGDARNMPEFPP